MSFLMCFLASFSCFLASFSLFQLASEIVDVLVLVPAQHQYDAGAGTGTSSCCTKLAPATRIVLQEHCHAGFCDGIKRDDVTGLYPKLGGMKHGGTLSALSMDVERTSNQCAQFLLLLESTISTLLALSVVRKSTPRRCPQHSSGCMQHSKVPFSEALFVEEGSLHGFIPKPASGHCRMSPLSLLLRGVLEKHPSNPSVHSRPVIGTRNDYAF